MAHMVHLAGPPSWRPGRGGRGRLHRPVLLSAPGRLYRSGDWLWDQLRYTESPYALLAERGGADPALENAARRDVGTLVLLARRTATSIIGAMKALLSGDWSPALAGLPRWSATAPFDFDSLTQFYREHGARALCQVSCLPVGGWAAHPRGRPGLPPAPGPAGLRASAGAGGAEHPAAPLRPSGQQCPSIWRRRNRQVSYRQVHALPARHGGPAAH